MGDYDDFETWQADLFARHAGRDGSRLVVGWGGPAVTGFAWGYTGQRGQYWSDLVGAALPGDAAVRLYRSRGWGKLGLLRPGTQVMGRHV